MQFIMALSTEHHCLPVSLDHLTFPHQFSFEIPQFPDMVDLYLTLLGPAPLALMSEKAFSQLGTIFVHQRIWFQIKILGRTHSSLELPG